MAFVTAVTAGATAVSSGRKIVNTVGGLFGGDDVSCSLDAVEGHPMVREVAQAMQSDPGLVRRVRTRILSMWPDHKCSGRIRQAGTLELAHWAVYIATGFGNRKVDDKDRRIADLLRSELATTSGLDAPEDDSGFLDRAGDFLGGVEEGAGEARAALEGAESGARRGVAKERAGRFLDGMDPTAVLIGGAALLFIGARVLG